MKGVGRIVQEHQRTPLFYSLSAAVGDIQILCSHINCFKSCPQTHATSHTILHIPSMISYYNKIAPQLTWISRLPYPFPYKTQTPEHSFWDPPIWPKLPIQQPHVCLLPTLDLRLPPLQIPTISQHRKVIQGSGYLVCPLPRRWMSPNFFTYQAHSSDHLETNLIFETLVNSIWYVLLHSHDPFH